MKPHGIGDTAGSRHGSYLTPWVTWTEPGEELRTVAVADPQTTRFATKDQADELALKIARMWVDGKLGPEPSA